MFYILVVKCNVCFAILYLVVVGGVGVSDESDVMVTCVLGVSLFGWIAINHHHPKVDFSSHTYRSRMIVLVAGQPYMYE